MRSDERGGKFVKECGGKARERRKGERRGGYLKCLTLVYVELPIPGVITVELMFKK